MKNKLQIDILKERSLTKNYATLTIGGGFALETFAFKDNEGKIEAYHYNSSFILYFSIF